MPPLWEVKEAPAVPGLAAGPQRRHEGPAARTPAAMGTAAAEEPVEAAGAAQAGAAAAAGQTRRHLREVGPFQTDGFTNLLRE